MILADLRTAVERLKPTEDSIDEFQDGNNIVDAPRGGVS